MVAAPGGPLSSSPLPWRTRAYVLPTFGLNGQLAISVIVAGRTTLLIMSLSLAKVCSWPEETTQHE